MTQIAILTPDPDETEYARHWPQVRDRLTRAFSSLDADVKTLPWTAAAQVPSCLGDADLILPLIVWSYHRSADRWLRACRVWQAAGLPMANPAEVLIWNTDKIYLRQLAAQGIAIAPTVWLDNPMAADVEAAFDTLGTDTVIIKPRISGGAYQTCRLQRGEDVGALPQGPTLIQPYLANIAREGELSLLFFGGRFSHAVRKTPVEGDFRIQSQFGGSYRAEMPPPEAMALAEQALGCVAAPLLYARVDMVRDENGRWLLMELELIEPDFYLAQDPVGGALFAEAVRHWLTR